MHIAQGIPNKASPATNRAEAPTCIPATGNAVCILNHPGSDWEAARLDALGQHDILNTPREEAFDRITRVAKKLFRVPFVFINMIDGHRAWSKSIQGMNHTESPRELSFCRMTILQSAPLVIPDATLDPRVDQSVYVLNDPHLRFYAGAPLSSADGYPIGTLCLVDTVPRTFDAEQTELLSDLARMAMDELELRLLATTDSLTKTATRRAFKEEAQRMVALALRHHHDLSCVSLDLDHFKTVNDTFGHAAGDRALATISAVCLKELRETDLMGRMGGEEFSVLLPHTNRSAAFDVAEKLRAAVEGTVIDIGTESLRVTASFGVASLDLAARDIETVLAHADAAVYDAKKAGRNRVVAWQPPEGEAAKPRRRVLKGGKILFNGRTSSMDCTVRGLSDDGAGIDISETYGVPKMFNLAIPADKFERPCRVTSQTERHLEVEFC